MSGNIWMFSDLLDDEDIDMLKRDFITYYQGADYYGLGLKKFTKMAQEAGAIYKVGTKKVLIRRDLFEEYLREVYKKNKEEEIRRDSLKNLGKEKKPMRKGNLILDDRSGRMDIRFGLDDYYGGLHCGECMEVLIDDEWIPTRIEMREGWYLVGINTKEVAGLTVRIK